MSDNLDSSDRRVVVAAFLHDKNEVLLAKRAPGKIIAPGKYHLPGGHVEYAENPASALARELREELKIDVLVCEPLWVFHYIWKSNHTVGIVFRVPLPQKFGRESLKWETNDIENCIWVREDALGNFLSPEDHNCVAALAGFEQLRRINGCP
jgi:mutator protein MutT